MWYKARVPSELAIVVVSYNNAEVLMRALAAALPVAKALGGELIVVDNDSPDGSADRVAREMPAARLFRRPNHGFAAGVNRGVSETTAKRLLLLNPDCFVTEAAVRRSIETLDSHPRIAAVGCRIVDGEGHEALSTRAFPTLRQYFLERFDLDRPYVRSSGATDVDTINGAFFLISRRAWNDVGPFDEGFFLYSEETDWCWRARRKGWRIVHEPRAQVVHLRGQSTKSGDEPILAHGLMLLTYLDSRERWWRKCYGPMQTWLMRAASIAFAAPGLLGSGRAVAWTRIKHALHLVHGKVR